MLTSKQKTISTYDKSAKVIAKRLDNSEPCNKHIDRAFEMIKIANPKVIELGCANGRDAKYILTKTSDYLGIDFSEELIKIAKNNVPNAKFIVADMVNYEIPINTDIVFAFASILHLKKQEFKKVLNNVYKSLKPGGIFYILTINGKYKERENIEELGTRFYYDYNEELIETLCESNYKIVYSHRKKYITKYWLSIALKKV